MLPPEILNAIFAFLATDPASLEACSNAHPVFRLLVEPSFYADITVHISPIKRTDNNTFPSFYAHELRTLLLERPHISNYIRIFNICPWISLTSATMGMVIVDLKAISTILHMLTSLKSIFFFFHHNHLDQTFWNVLPGCFRTALIACLRLPSLKELGLGNVRSFPLAILDDILNIKTISLTNMRDVRYSESDMPTYSPLQVLSVYSFEEELEQIILWVKTRQLQSLQFHVRQAADVGKIAPLLRNSNSLTTLDLDLFTFFQTTYANDMPQDLGQDVTIPLYFASFHHLQRLVVRSQATCMVEPFPKYSWSLPAISRLIDSASSLKNITLHFHFHLHGFMSVSEMDWSSLDWSPLDLHFPPMALQHIDLHVTATLVHSSNPTASESIPPAIILSSLSRNRHIIQVVEKGLLTIRTQKLPYLTQRKFQIKSCHPGCTDAFLLNARTLIRDEMQLGYNGHSL